jgi:hypothetical protein
VKKLIVIAAVLGCLAVLNHSTSPVKVAHAADRWLATLSSIDAGPSNVYCATNANLPAELESLTDGYCYKACATSACVPDCTKDYQPAIKVVAINNDGGSILRQVPFTYQLPMGPDKCVVVMPLDGGQLKVNVYQLTAPNPYAGPSF